MARWALIFNPTAGRFTPRTFDALQLELRRLGVTPLPMPTHHPGHATQLAAAVERVERVAVYGGDGTLNEVANGLAGRDLPLVFLPGGTANVMAHELGLPHDPVRAAAALVHAEPRPVRPGRIGKRLFLLMAGLGFDGEAVSRVSVEWKARIGKGAYVWAGLRTLLSRSPALTVRTPGGTERTAAWAVAARAKRYGGRFAIHPRAGLEQPALGLTLVRRWGLLPFVAGNLGLGLPWAAPGASFGESTEIEVRAESPIHVQVDGDYLGSGTEFRIDLAEAAIPFCFPVSVR